VTQFESLEHGFVGYLKMTSFENHWVCNSLDSNGCAEIWVCGLLAHLRINRQDYRRYSRYVRSKD
jgi:hypothetical protein